MSESRSPTDLATLLDLVATLRAPDGCPWDRTQKLADVRAYLLEEAHEVAAAIDTGDWEALGGELGDLLFQVVFLARLGEETGALRLAEVLERNHAKMVARHPHVFGGEALADAESVRQAWERRKLQQQNAAGGSPRSLLDGAAASLPALLAAYRMTQKAAGVGFDWPDAAAVLAKLDEELGELRAELATEPPPGAASAAATGTAAAEARKDCRIEELGDLLFTVANLARHLEIDPELALARANLKFRRRFARVEGLFAERHRDLGQASLAELDAAWDEAKREGL